MRLPPRTILKALSYWPPFLAAGIKVGPVADDVTRVTVSLRIRPWTKNYFGTHFGGSLYAMCDPFYVFLLMHQLGPEYIIWDRAAKIDFLKATDKPVSVTFSVSPDEVAKIRESTLTTFSVAPTFTADVTTSDRTVVATVGKTLYVRRKDAKTRFATDVESSDVELSER